METLINFAAGAVLYDVHIEMELLIPLVYSVSMFMALGIKQFAPHKLKYPLSILFVLSFGAWWFVMLMDNSIFKWVIPAIIFMGACIPMFGWFHHVIDKIKKLGDDNSFFH